MNLLIKYLAEKHGLKADATLAEAKSLASKLLKSGELDGDKYVELCEGSKSVPDIDMLTKGIALEIGKAMKPLSDRLAALEGANEDGELDDDTDKAAAVAGKKHKSAVKLEDTTDEDPSLLLTKGLKGNVRVKEASEQYRSNNKSAVIYPETHRKGGRHGLAGRPVEFEGRAIDSASDAEKAMSGALMACYIMGGLSKSVDNIPDHILALATEGLHKLRFNGEVHHKGQTVYYRGEKLRPEHCQKTVFAEATSGGSNLIPQILEDEIIYPVLLINELTPYVTVVPMARGTSVDTPTGVHMTLTSVANEQTAISAQSTAGLFGLLNTPIHGCQGEVRFGRDFLTDTPIDVMMYIRQSYSDVLANWLDEQIAVGDGAIEPLGIFNTAGTTVVGQQSPSPTGWDVDDVEEILKSLPKQYRKGPNVRWVSTDATYFGVRGIPVGSADARRVFGMTHEDYKVFDHGWSVQDDVGNANVALVDLKWYRLRRRLGIEIRTSDDGITLMEANSMVVIVRSRWGGRLMQPAAMAEFNSAPSTP